MLIGSLYRNKRGATSIEFALVAFALVGTILFIMTTALIMYFTFSLDYAASKAARQVMTGTVQKNGVAQAAFKSGIVCPYLTSSIVCSNVFVNLQTVSEAAQPGGYYAYVNSSATALLVPVLSDASSTYSPGSQQSYEYLQLVYPVTFLPAVFARMLGGGATFNGAPAFLIVATAAFRNEQY